MTYKPQGAANFNSTLIAPLQNFVDGPSYPTDLVKKAINNAQQTYRQRRQQTNAFVDDSKDGVFQGKVLDRSAHSLINRFVLNSSGTEIERIENYDVIASQINDILYSSEQLSHHHTEGFPDREIPLIDVNDKSSIAQQMIDKSLMNGISRSVGEHFFGRFMKRKRTILASTIRNHCVLPKPATVDH